MRELFHKEYLKLSTQKIAVVGLSTLLLTGCMTFKDPRGLETPPPIGENATLPAAANYAADLRKVYASHITERDRLRNAVNFGLIPAAATGAVLGIQGGHADTILGLAAGGTGAVLLSQSFARASDETIYNVGITALDCVSGAFNEVQSAATERNDLVDLIGGKKLKDDGKLTAFQKGRLSTAAADVKAALGAAGTVPDELANEASAAFARANDASRQGHQLIIKWDAAGGQYVSGINGVQTAVVAALGENRLEPAAFQAAIVQAFNGALEPLRVVTPETPAEKKGDLHAREWTERDKTNQNEVRKKITALNAEIADAEAIIAHAQAMLPTKEQLSGCAAFPGVKAAVFAVDQQDPITLPQPAAAQVVTFTLSGGAPPYSADWSGSYPTGTLSQPRVFSSGRVEATIPAGLAVGTYEIRAADSQGTKRFVQIKVVESAATGKAAGQTGTTNASKPNCLEGLDEDQAKAVQQFLLDHHLSIGAGITVPDGRICGETQKSMREYAKQNDIGVKFDGDIKEIFKSLYDLAKP